MLQGEAVTKYVTFQSAATAAGDGTAHSAIGFSGCAVQITGTVGTGVVNFEGSVDGTNYEPLMAVNLETGDMESAQASASAGIWFVNCQGFSLIRCRISGTPTAMTVTGRMTTGASNLPAMRAELTVDSIEIQLDDTDKLSVSLYGTDTAAGDMPLNASSGGNLEVDLVAFSGQAPQLDDTDKLAVSMYGYGGAAGDVNLLCETGGELQVSLHVGSQALQLDDTDKLAVSIYGKDTAAGDKEVNVSTVGNLEADIVAFSGTAPQLDDTDKLAVSMYGYGAAAGDVNLLCEATGELQVSLHVGSQALQLDDTDKLAVSLYGKDVAAGDKEVNVSTAGNVEVDIHAAGTAIASETGGELKVSLHVGAQALQLDDTDKLAVSLYGKDVASGDKEVNVSTAGNVEVDIHAAGTAIASETGGELKVSLHVGAQALQLDDTDKLAVSLYGKSVAAGDTEVAVDATGNVQVDIVSSATITADTELAPAVAMSGGMSYPVTVPQVMALPIMYDVVGAHLDRQYGWALGSTIDLQSIDIAPVVSNAIHGWDTAYGKSGGFVPVPVESTTGNLHVSLNVGAQALQLDDTDKLAVSLYGKDVASGDKEVNVSTAGNMEVDIHAAGTAIASETGGELKVSLHVGAQALQLDDTDKLAVSLYGKNVAAGDKEVNVSANGNLETDIYASGSPLLSSLSALHVMLKGTDSSPGDIQIGAESSGQLEVSLYVGSQQLQLDSTDHLAVSLWGKNSAAGDTEVNVSTAGSLKILGQLLAMTEVTNFELIGIDEQVDQNEFSEDQSFTLNANGGIIYGARAVMAFSGTTGASIREAGWVYLFDADPGLSVGDTALASAAVARTCFGGFALAAADWSPVAGAFNIQTVELQIPFHGVATAYAAYFHEGATSFNDGANDDEILELSLWYRSHQV